MLPYNIEIFDREFNLVQYYVTDMIDYKFDYLSVTENNVVCPFNEDIEKGNYIRLRNNVHTFLGYVSSISVDDPYEGYSTIGFKPLMSLFDSPILFDVSTQGVGYLENAIADIISDYFINNDDSSQNIQGLEVSSVDATGDWTFYYTEDVEGSGVTIINLLELIQLAMTKYGIGIYFDVDFTNQIISCQVGITRIDSFTIEADLPNVINKTVIVNETEEDINKLVVYNEDDFTESISYYLHSDDSYDTTNDDRITPVIYSIESTTATDSLTFEEAAAEIADKVLGNKKVNNLIEIEISNDDSMVNPSSLEVGQWVTIITNGKSYYSMLTGYEFTNYTKLTFGTIRLELTKILKEVLK